MHTVSRLVAAVSILMLILLSCGEKEKVVEVEVPSDCPPSAPRGLIAYNLDGYVELCWYPNPEDDIDGYDVYYGEEAYGDYYYIGTVWAVYPDPAVVTAGMWTPVEFPLSEFSAAGVNLAAVKKMYIGLGDRNAPTPGGAGLIYIDDIRVTRPEPTQ